MITKKLKTTIVATVMLVLGVFLFVMFILGFLEESKFGIALAGLGTFGAMIIGYFADDEKKRSTLQKRGTVDPDPLSGPRDTRGR